MTLSGRMTVTTAVACVLTSTVFLPLFTRPPCLAIRAGAALAGSPLLVLFTVPVMMNASHNQFTTGVVFCLGGAGYMAMLSADGRERIRVWGRLVSLWRTVPRHSQTSDGGVFNGGVFNGG